MSLRELVLGAVCGAAVFLAAGCSAEPKSPPLNDLYSRAAQEGDDNRNPVVVIPGILGSRLVQPGTRQVVWGAFGGGAVDPEDPEGARTFGLPMREGVPLSELTDDVVPDGVLDRVKVDLGILPIELSAYAQILSSLGVGGYRDQLLGTSGAVDYGPAHFTCFQFDYDWRRDAVENVKRLHAWLTTQREFITKELAQRGLPHEDVKFDVVAHSMGGLLLRYYLMYGDADLPSEGPLPAPTWAGTRNIGRVILVGTPSFGSVLSLKSMTQGVQYAAILPRFEPALMGTFPSIYQLLPRTRHGAVIDGTTQRPVDIFDAREWERLGWGLAASDQDFVLQQLLPDVENAADRRRIALDHLNKCLRRARRFSEALDVRTEAPAGFEISLIAGDAEPTPSVVEVSEAGAFSIKATAAGDGTVTRASALADERQAGMWQRRLVGPVTWTQVTFLAHDHIGLTQDPVFTDNVLYYLLERPR